MREGGAGLQDSDVECRERNRLSGTSVGFGFMETPKDRLPGVICFGMRGRK